MVPAIEVHGLVLVCPESDLPPMALHECCCAHETGALHDALARLPACCCEIRLSWRVATPHDEVILAASLKGDSVAPVFSPQEERSLDLHPSSSARRPVAVYQPTAPVNLYLLHHSLLI